MRPHQIARLVSAVALAAALIGGANHQIEVSAATTVYGLTIPAEHPRLWWTPERVERAKEWLRGNPQDPRTDDGLALATSCVFTGDQQHCQAAVAYAMRVTCDAGACTSPNPSVGVAADEARWEGETVILIYDWCHSYFSPRQRATLIDRWNTYLSNIRRHEWGGPNFVQSNYNWGYMRNEIEWGVATWGENPQADASLRYALVDRWQTSILPHLTSGGKGGVFQEGSAYGSAIGEYSAVPFTSGALLGRDLYRESNFFREAVMYVVYATLPAPTVNVHNGMSFAEMFPFADDERFMNGGMPARVNYGAFMQSMADYWRDVPIGQYARRWVASVNPVTPPYITSVDRGGDQRDFSALPLDYFAPGAQFVYTRNRWGSDATVVNLQLGLTADEGHRHNDLGSWQMWRNGRWLSRETTGYSNEIAGYGGAGVDTNTFAAHNTLLVDGKGPAHSHQNGPPTMTRLESTADYSYAAADLTESYRATHPTLENPAVARVEREFLFIRPLEALVIFDRVETFTANAPVTFLAHFETAPAAPNGHVVSAVNGTEELRIATLLPAPPTYRPVVSEGSTVGQYRLEIETRGSKQTHFLNILQAKAASGANLDSSVVDEGNSYRVTLTHPAKGSATLTLRKSTGGSRGTVAVGAKTYSLTDSVAEVSVTDEGPVWRQGAAAVAAPTGVSAIHAYATRAVRTIRGSDSVAARGARAAFGPAILLVEIALPLGVGLLVYRRLRPKRSRRRHRRQVSLERLT